MKIRAAVTTAALLVILAACGSTPTAGVASAANGGDTGAGVASADASSAPDGAADGAAASNADANSDGAADDSAAASDSDDAPVVENAESGDEPGATDGDAADGASDGPAANSPEAIAFCKQLIAAQDKLTAVQQNSGGDLKALGAALGEQAGVFQKLRTSAPAQVQPALDDIVQVLQTAQQALSGATPDASALANMGTYIPGDMAALSNYVGDNCAMMQG